MEKSKESPPATFSEMLLRTIVQRLHRVRLRKVFTASNSLRIVERRRRLGSVVWAFASVTLIALLCLQGIPEPKPIPGNVGFSQRDLQGRFPVDNTRSWSNSLFENFYGEPEVRDIALDSSSNLLFLATTYGLLIHNTSSGSTELFTMADGLASHYVNALAYDARNNLLFLGSANGLDIMDVENRTFTHRDLQNWSSDTRVQSLEYYDEANRLFLGFGQSLIEYDADSDAFVVLREDRGVRTMAIDSNLGRLYFGPLGLNIYDMANETYDVRTIAHGLPHEGVTSIDMTADGHTLFVGTHGGGFCIYDVLADSFQTVNSTSGLSADYVWTVRIDEERNRLYLGVGTEVYLGLERHWFGLDVYDLQNGSFTNLNMSSGMTGNATIAMEFDAQQGKLYIGITQTVEDRTDLPGLNVYNSSDSSVYSIHLGDGLPTSKANRIAIDYERDIVFTGSTRGLVMMEKGTETFQVKDVTDGLASNLVRGMALDSLRGHLYLGGYEGLNIYNLTGDSFGLRNTSHGLPSNVIECIFVDESDSLVYVGTLDGLSIYDSVADSFTNLDGSSFPRARVCPLEMDYTRRLLYVGTTGGLGIYNTSTGEVVNKYESDGLSYRAIQDVRVGPDGTAYIATADGFSIYDPDSDTFESMFSSDGLVDNLTYGVEVLYESNLVVVSALGGFNFYDINASTFCCPFREVDGLPSNAPSILEVDHEDKLLYISSGGGLTRFDLTHVASPELSAPSSPDFDGSFQLTWTEIWNANEYALEQANSSSFDSPQVVYSGSNISVPIGVTTHGFYYYRVKATNWLLGDSGWSDIVAVEVIFPPSSPTLHPIGDHEAGETYQVEWSTISLASTYELEEDVDEDFSSPVLVYTGSGASIDFSKSTNGTYFYRVRARNLAGNSTWSNVERTEIRIPAGPSDDTSWLPALVGITLLVLLIILLVWILHFKRRKPEDETSNEH